jgi:hypothetical protein
VGEPHRIPAAELTALEAHRYTPTTPGALERMVKLLNQYYPRCTTVECRESLASMYGYDSWSMLETAATRGDSSAYDEDETDDRVTARRNHQTHMVLMHCGGVTKEDASAAARIDKDLAAAGGISISRRHDPFWRRQRVVRARYAYNAAYARHAIDEIRPSARDRHAIPIDDQGLHMSVRVDLLPRALVIWLERQRPRMGGLADRMAAMRMRQHSQCDLLNFAFAWGEACISHPTDIPEALQLYPLVLCATWYGWNAYAGAVPAVPVIQRRLPGQQKAPSAGLVVDPTLEHQQVLLRAQPREDVAAVSVAVRERQMEAGYALLRPHIQDAAASQPICSFISKPAWIAKTAVAGQAMN